MSDASFAWWRNAGSELVSVTVQALPFNIGRLGGGRQNAGFSTDTLSPPNLD